MPSIKSCIASLAVMAMTLAPMVSAKGVHADALAGRDLRAGGHLARAVSSPGVAANFDKRAAAKAAAAKRALARREAKAAANAAPVAQPVSGPATVSSYLPGSEFLTSVLSEDVVDRRCGSDAACQASVTVTANAKAYCYESMCTPRCNQGFRPMSDGTCASDATCGPTACTSVSAGYNSCTGATGNICLPTCYNGASLYSNGSKFACYYTLTDKNHCGQPEAKRLKICNAKSYNGKGTPACVNGECTLSCPALQHPYPAQSHAHPFLCA